jgi:hypothetical protein
MDAMIAARFNTYWFLSLAVPAVAMLFTTFWRKRYIFIAGAVVSLLATYYLSNLAVQAKWRTRFELAKTEQELEYASADGANLVFTLFFGAPLEAVVYTGFWGFVGWRFWSRVKPAPPEA